MNFSEIAFVVYPVTDLPRARRFYEVVLGLTATSVFGSEDKGWVEYDIGPGTLAISNFHPNWKPASGGCLAGLEVDDLESAISRIKAAGVEADVHETPVCFMGLTNDPDGNALIIHKRKA